MAYLSNRQAPLCGADPFGLELLHASISLVTKSDARVRFSVPTFFLLYDLWSLYVVGLRVRTRAVHGSSRNGKTLSHINCNTSTSVNFVCMRKPGVSYLRLILRLPESACRCAHHMRGSLSFSDKDLMHPSHEGACHDSLWGHATELY